MKNSNKKGFTLVELVVVIAIIGVLAAILVPSMMGYVKKARLKTANGNAKTGYNAAADFFTEQETQGLLGTTTLAQGQSAAEAALAANGTTKGVLALTAGPKGKSSPADWDDDMDYYCYWEAAANDDIVGRYPNPGVKIDSGKAVDAEGDEVTFPSTSGT
ncbi:type II secretion system protein [uncultured Ruminococcus sp.]|uniref:type II secretion system protein n=1 Tax=uncultured Ruminococcus sp. TaxID=165186 RepID=UPI0025CD4037|nr:type II secretion system protein [uncultured Ruminococcus sp.]